MLFSAVEPGIPAVNLQADVNDLQKHVRIELHLVKNHNLEQHLDEACGPAENALADGEINAGEAEHHGGNFEPAYACC